MLLIHRNRNCHHAAGNLKRTIGPLKIYGAQHSTSGNVGSCLLPHHIIQRGRSLIGHKACHPLLNCNIGFIKQLAAVDIACSNAHLGHLIAKARKQLLALLRSLCLHVFGISIGHKPCQHPAREAYHYAHASLHRGFPPPRRCDTDSTGPHLHCQKERLYPTAELEKLEHDLTRIFPKCSHPFRSPDAVWKKRPAHVLQESGDGHDVRSYMAHVPASLFAS